MTVDCLAIAKSVFDTEIKYMGSLYETLNSNFEKAVQLIVKTPGRVIVSGVGKSGIVAKKIAATLSSIGRSSVFINSGEASHGDLGTISYNDVVVLISNSGNSSELVNIIDYCKNLNVPIVSILGGKDSLLYKASDAPILLPNFSEIVLKVPSTSFTLTSMIGDAIVACIVEERKVTFAQYKKYHPGGRIGNSLISVKNIMRVGDKLPCVRTGSLMSEALIIMTEKSLGCVIVVNKEGEILGIITDGDLRRHMSLQLVSMNVEDVMSYSPRVIDPECYVTEALSYMNEKRITNLIVAQNRKVIGIVHMHDCLRFGLELVES